MGCKMGHKNSKTVCTCAAGPACHRIQSCKKPAAYLSDMIEVHKIGNLSGKILHLCDGTALKKHKAVYELRELHDLGV